MPGALVLNASYEPLSVVNVHRAVVLVLTGKAVIVESRPASGFRSEHAWIPAPSIVRLTVYVNVPYRIGSSVTRRGVFGRDGYRCVYCSGPAESIDHVVPRSRGGTHTWDNVVSSCRQCNVKKGDRLLSEMGIKLSCRPGPPNRYHWVFTNSGFNPDPTWERFIARSA